MSSKKQLKKKIVESDSESESDNESVTEQQGDIIDDAEGVIDEDDENEEDYEEYVEGEGEEVDEVGSNAELKDNADKDELECYFEYDNVIDEYANLGPPTQVPDDERITLNKLTKYEMVRVLGIRAQQISVGAKSLVKNIEGKSPVEIAIYELKNKMTPFKIKRPLPNNTYEIWKIKELEVDIPDEKEITTSFN